MFQHALRASGDARQMELTKIISQAEHSPCGNEFVSCLLLPSDFTLQTRDAVILMPSTHLHMAPSYSLFPVVVAFLVTAYFFSETEEEGEMMKP